MSEKQETEKQETRNGLFRALGAVVIIVSILGIVWRFSESQNNVMQQEIQYIKSEIRDIRIDVRDIRMNVDNVLQKTSVENRKEHNKFISEISGLIERMKSLEREVFYCKTGE